MKSRPILFYPGKGQIITAFTDVFGKRHVLRNEGLPFVNVHRNPNLTPFSGGKPRGRSVKDLTEEVKFFKAGTEEMVRRQAVAAMTPEGEEEETECSDESLPSEP